ncbi:MAG TPA: glycosyl hydrolase family 28 protein [Terracidiphilus sp.]|nr:glycosyl hydrolase family 28 protein [Terracidiphilus sp.]
MLRRDFLSTVPFALGVAATGNGFSQFAQASKSILEFGAKPDGRTLNTRAIQRAIDDVFRAGGGTVNVPEGTFLTGRIELKARVTLNLQTGSTLLGSTSINDYNAESGSSHNNPRHLIFAQDADDVTLTGPGRIDGQGPSFWEPSGRAPLPPDEEWADVASHSLAPKKSGRPSPMLEFINCQRLKIKGVHIENAPGWTLRTVNSDNVEIRGVSIKNPTVGPNTDGMDITGCQNVLITDCVVDTGDDAICLKSENPFGPEPRLLKNIEVTNCTLTTCCNGFKLGTSSEGGFENIKFSNSIVRNGPVPFRERVISGIALEVVDGGWIDGVEVTGIRMERTRTAIFIRLENRKHARDNPQHGIRNVSIENVQATEALLASSITGLPGMSVQDVTLSHIQVQNVLPARPESISRSVPEKESAYPEARMFGMLPASGLYVRHVRNLHLNDLVFTATAGEARPAVIFDDVDGAQVHGLTSAPAQRGTPILEQIGSRDVQIL